MSWIPFGFNLCLALLFAGYVVYRVRRFERRADAILAKLDRRHEERMRALELWAAEDKAELRATVDRLVAKAEAEIERANAELRAMAEYQPDPEAADDPSRTEPLPH